MTDRDAITFPRYHGGHVDSGAVRGSRRCPNCNSNLYRETVSLESCTACGLLCDYWGGGANGVYLTMMADRDAAQRAIEFENELREAEREER